MKHALFLAVTSLYAVVGTFAVGPHVGVIVYYCYAMLRPQFLWQWSLAAVGGDAIQWSFFVAVGAMAGTLTGGSGPRPRLGSVHYAVWGLAAWVTLSFVFARHPDKAQPYYMEMVKLYVMFTCGAFAVRTLSHLWAMTVAVVLVDVYVAYEMNFFYLTSALPKDWVTISGGLDNNGVALMFAMGVPVCYFLWEATRHPVRWVYIAGIALLGHGVLLSMSRGAMLSLIVSSPLLLVLSQRKKQVVGFFALALVAVAATAGPAVQARFLTISEHDADESANSRKTAWAIAIRMANEEPIFGFGVRNSVLYTRAYGADMEGRAIHSMYLQLAADSGWVGMLWFIAVLVAVGVAVVRVWKRYAGRTDPDAVRARALAAASGCGLGVYAVGAVFLSLDTFEMPFILALLAGQLQGLTLPLSGGPGTAPAGPPLVPGWPYPWLPLSAPVRPAAGS